MIEDANTFDRLQYVNASGFVEALPSGRARTTYKLTHNFNKANSPTSLDLNKLYRSEAVEFH